jgi:capsular polysaccharide biosynthesis protein
MGESIGLLDIFRILIKRWRIILLTTLIGVLIGTILSYWVLPNIYQASTKILVNQKSSESNFDYSLMRSNVDLINTYSDIIKSPAILDKVIKRLDLNQSLEQLENNITIISQNNSQVFTLVVKSREESTAVSIANTISETFQYEVKSIMNVDNVSIIAKAEKKENPVPISPIPILYIAVSILIGFLLGAGISFLMEYLDNSLKTEEDVASVLNLPVLGSVQEMSKYHKKVRKGSATTKTGSENIVSYAEK